MAKRISYITRNSHARSLARICAALLMFLSVTIWVADATAQVPPAAVIAAAKTGLPKFIGTTKATIGRCFPVGRITTSKLAVAPTAQKITDVYEPSNKWYCLVTKDENSADTGILVIDSLKGVPTAVSFGLPGLAPLSQVAKKYSTRYPILVLEQRESSTAYVHIQNLAPDNLTTLPIAKTHQATLWGTAETETPRLSTIKAELGRAEILQTVTNSIASPVPTKGAITK